MGKGWTEERRKKQAEAIKRWKPWERSTGPRTEAGKERCKMNACKDETLYEARKVLRLHREFMKQYIKYRLADEGRV